MRDANALEEPQSGSMGEGWSDYFALTLRNAARDDERTVTGTWVVNSSKGIRQRPYDSAYPGRFGHIGLGRGQVPGAADLSYNEVHAVGEIWCAALMQLTRNVVAALGDKQRGYRIGWRAVVDGMKLTPKNPSMLGGARCDPRGDRDASSADRRRACSRSGRGVAGVRLVRDGHRCVVSERVVQWMPGRKRGAVGRRVIGGYRATVRR